MILYFGITIIEHIKIDFVENVSTRFSSVSIIIEKNKNIF